MLHPAFRVVVVAASLLVCSPLVRAQNEPPAHPPRPKILGPAKWNPSPQEIFCRILDSRARLEYRSGTAQQPALARADDHTGAAYCGRPGAVACASDSGSATRRVTRLAEPRPIRSENSQCRDLRFAVFRFNGLDTGNLIAATIVRHEGQPIDFHFDADEAGNPDYRMGGIEGIWWLPAKSSSRFLILSNPSGQMVRGSLVLSSPSKNLRIPLGIGPGQTKRIDLREALGPSNIAAIGGLTLSLPRNESLSATQIVFDEVTGLAAIMKLFDREPGDQPVNHILRAPMDGSHPAGSRTRVPEWDDADPSHLPAECRIRTSSGFANRRLAQRKQDGRTCIATNGTIARRGEGRQPGGSAEVRANTGGCNLGHRETRMPSKSGLGSSSPQLR